MRIPLINVFLFYCIICVCKPIEVHCDSLKISFNESTDAGRNISFTSDHNGDFISLSAGNFFVVKKDVIYGGIDININLAKVSKGLYLNLGGYYFDSESSKLSGHLTPGYGFYILDKNIFSFFGAGCIINKNFIGFDFMLRVNYRISQLLFIGFDSKFLSYTPLVASDNKREKALLIGMNISYRFNY